MTVYRPEVPPVARGGDCRAFGYVPDERWAKVAADRGWADVVGVATDRHDRVFVFHRGEPPVMVFTPDGTLTSSWGEGLFTRPHGITVGPDGAVFCTDDVGHSVRKFSPDGRLLLTLEAAGAPSDTGATSMDFRGTLRAGPPFHYPTNLAVSPTGELYVSDGYGNARVHVFSAEGRLLFSWGEPGAGPGQFHLPHGVAVDRRGTVYVADRENSRVQLFTARGAYLAEWTDLARPCQVFIGGEGNVFVAELGYHAAMWPGTTAPGAEAPGGRVSVFDPGGTLLARWGGGQDPCAPGDFLAPHGICVDSRGDVYVGEVVRSGGGQPSVCHTLQKFVRREP